MASLITTLHVFSLLFHAFHGCSVTHHFQSKACYYLNLYPLSMYFCLRSANAIFIPLHHHIPPTGSLPGRRETL